METLRIPLAGSRGVNKDLSIHELAEGVWSDANNIRFLDGYAQMFYDFEAIYDTPPMTPYYLMPITVGSEWHWLYAGASTIYDVHLNLLTGVIHTDISHAAYTAQPNDWTGGMLGGVPILNNPTDGPLFWDQVLANPVQPLTAWPAEYTCESMRPFGNFLIALNVTKPGGSFPYLVKWSHPADPGSVPASWDETDPAYDAGEYPLASGTGEIVDGLQLRNSFIIYQKESVWRMDLIGGINVFRFDKVLGVSGALNKNCVVEIDGQHFVLTNSDLIIHDGQNSRSILDKVTRRSFFREMDEQENWRAFVFKNHYFNEVCVCYPSIGSTHCDRMMVWNYVDNTVSFRDTPGIHHAAYGPVRYDPSETWDEDDDSWDSDLTYWNQAANVPGRARVLAAGSSGSLYLQDSKAASAGPPSAFLERRGMSFEYPHMFKHISGVRPRIHGASGNIRISIGGTDNDPYADPTWDEVFEFEIGVDVLADFSVERRYVAMKIENIDSFQFRLDSMDVMWDTTSEW